MGAARRGVRGLTVAVALVLAACSGANDDSATTTVPGEGELSPTTATTPTGVDVPLTVEGSTYVVPDPLPDGAPGEVLGTAARPAVARLAGATRTTFLYRSTDASGTDHPVSAVLLVPSGEAPDGGWPVISWGHGTTGVADVCAPSLTDNLFYNEYAQQVTSLLDAGYAVVATDYVGLGTPGMHSYLVGVDEGNALVDAVTAAHQIEADLSPTWFAVGHSQGGQAALFATRAAERAPDLDLAAAVAIAPASGLEVALPAIVAGGVPADLVYGIYALAGLTTVDDELDLASTLGPEATRRLDLITEEGCLVDTLRELGPISVEDIFSLTPEQAAELSQDLAAVGNPEEEPTVGPVLVLQGTEDHDVPVGLTEQMVRRLEAAGSDVELRLYEGLNHDEVLGPSMCDLLAWLEAHGGPAVEDCVPQPTDLS